jgi:hypothetical protein
MHKSWWDHQPGLQAEQGHRPSSPSNIEMMRAKDFDVRQLISHTELVVGLKFVTVARVTDALKVFSAVRIPCPQSPNKSCWHDVVHMSSYTRLLKIHTARLHLAISAQG